MRSRQICKKERQVSLFKRLSKKYGPIKYPFTIPHQVFKPNEVGYQHVESSENVCEPITIMPVELSIVMK